MKRREGDAQGSLDLPGRLERETPPKPKRVAVTSLMAYRKVAGTMSRRLGDTAAALQDYIEAHDHYPTSWELYNWMEAKGDPRKAFDISGLRSVLTGLRDKGLIYAPRKRKCSYSGETAMVWAPDLNREERREVLPGRRVSEGATVEGEGTVAPLAVARYTPRELVDDWNTACPIGTPVWVCFNYPEGWKVVEGRSHTEAQLWSGRALIKVFIAHDSVRVCSLQNVRPIAPGEDLPPPPFGEATQAKEAQGGV